MTYEPQPGTIQHRVIEHLRTLPAGSAKVPTAVLADLLDHDPAVIREALDPLRHMGVLVAERGAGKGGPLSWGLGFFEVQPKGDEDGEPKPSRQRAPRQAPEPAAAPAPEPAAAMSAPEPEPEPAPAPKQRRARRAAAPAAAEPAPAERAMQGARAAIYSSGELAIETTDQRVIVFEPAAAREVIAFLKRLEVPA